MMGEFPHSEEFYEFLTPYIVENRKGYVDIFYDGAHIRFGEGWSREGMWNMLLSAKVLPETVYHSSLVDIVPCDLIRMFVFTEACTAMQEFFVLNKDYSNGTEVNSALDILKGVAGYYANKTRQSN